MYKIKLENFEGPLDLLLFFVRKDELNIYDIPIAYITKQYLDYLHLMQSLNLDIAGEFILMAATLMRIKAKMMLPPDPLADEEELLDPRQELSRRLIEYRQFKEASKSLGELDEYWRTIYRRSYFNFDLLPQQTEEAVGLKDISFFDLLTAYKNALAKKPAIIYHNVERLNITVEDQQKYIMSFFRDRKTYRFTELCEDMSKIEVVVTFLALLDLIKREEIAVRQTVLFDDIWIYKSAEYSEDIPDEQKAIINDEVQFAQALVSEPLLVTGEMTDVRDEIKDEPFLETSGQKISDEAIKLDPTAEDDLRLTDAEDETIEAETVTPSVNTSAVPEQPALTPGAEEDIRTAPVLEELQSTTDQSGDNEVTVIPLSSSEEKAAIDAAESLIGSEIVEAESSTDKTVIPEVPAVAAEPVEQGASLELLSKETTSAGKVEGKPSFLRTIMAKLISFVKTIFGK